MEESKDYLLESDIKDNIIVIKINNLYRDGISNQELYEVTRGYWKRNIESVKDTKYALSVADGVVVEVYKILRWLPSGSLEMTTRETQHIEDRIEFEGEVATDLVRSRYINKSIVKLFKSGEANPLKCFKATSNMSFRDMLFKVLNEYADVFDTVWKTQQFTNPLFNFFNGELRAMVSKIVFKFDDRLIVKSSTGAGRTTTCPWIIIANPEITVQASKGAYLVYLFNKDTKDVYLCFGKATTEVEKKVEELGFTGRNKQKEIERIFIEEKLSIRNTLNLKGFSTNDSDVNTGNKGYDLAEICYVKYNIDALPEDIVLIQDLHNMIDIYNAYYKIFYLNIEGGEDPVVEEIYTDKEIIDQVNQYIQSKGFSYPTGMIENFYLSLKSKPFVILAGISGTGKTRLVKLFSEAIQAKYKVVPVRPDWSDSSDLFGHLDLNGTFVSGQVIDFIKEAIDHPNEPHILLLDEMNLARVEYYLSDFLSVIETRDIEDGKFVSSPLVSEAIFGDDEDARSKYGDMIYPENLYVVGTVNMDETTFPFSKKVLDRANTIEFSYVNLEPSFANFGASKTIKVENSFLSTKYLFLKDCISQKEKVTSICKELQEINNLLQKNNLHVGYRVRDEIVFYLLNNLETGLLSEEVALDNEIMQKILPRIQGSSTNLKKVLIELFIHCVPAFTKPTSEYDNIADDMFKSLDKAEYKNSATKIAFMVRRFEEDGFTSYWL